MLEYHRDFESKTRFPLLQFNILLSEPNVDYNGGEFVFKDNNNNEIFINRDLKATIGDALVFDKYLLHKVENTHLGNTDIGRWTILIGARAKYTNLYEYLIKKNYFYNLYQKKLKK